MCAAAATSSRRCVSASPFRPISLDSRAAGRYAGHTALSLRGVGRKSRPLAELFHKTTSLLSQPVATNK